MHTGTFLHFNVITFNRFLFVPQLLRLVVSEKRWKARSRGGGSSSTGVDGWSDEGEEGFESGDCDDEDECTGVSGLGPPLRRKRLRIFAGERHDVQDVACVVFKMKSRSCVHTEKFKLL